MIIDSVNIKICYFIYNLPLRHKKRLTLVSYQNQSYG